MIVRGVSLLSDGSLVMATSGMNGGGIAHVKPTGELAWFVDLPAGAGAQPLVLDDDVCVVRGLAGDLLVVAPDGTVTATVDHGHPTVADGGVPIAQASCSVDGSILVRVDVTGDSDAANDAEQGCEIVAYG